MSFDKRSNQLILRYLYTEVTKRRGEISLQIHFKVVTPPLVLSFRQEIFNLLKLSRSTLTIFSVCRNARSRLATQKIFSVCEQKIAGLAAALKGDQVLRWACIYLSMAYCLHIRNIKIHMRYKSD